MSDTVSESFWQWGDSKFHRQRRQAMNTRTRLDGGMVETIAGMQEIQEAINAFYLILLDKFVDDESSVISTMEASLFQLKEMQLLDFKERIMGGSFAAFQKAYTTNTRQPLMSARMAGDRALEMVQQLNSLLASIRDGLNISKIAPELDIIKAALYIADSRIQAAFQSLENKTDPHVPDNMVENRYKRLQRCLEERDTIPVLTSKITQMVNQITQTVDLENTNCPLFKFPLSASSPALETEDPQHSLGCALGKSISHYLSALHIVRACLTDYGNVLNGWDSWLRKVETDLRKTRFSISISNNKMYHLERKSRYLEWIGNLRERYAAGEETIFDLQSSLCDVTTNQMLQDTEYAMENIENEIIIRVQSHLSEISSLFVGHYVEGLKGLSPFYYYFEDPAMKEFFDTSARSLHIWRKPVFQPGHKSITFLHEPGVYWYSWPQAQTLENFISTNGRNVIGALMDGAILDLAHQLQDAKVMISESQRILARKQHRLCSRLEKITSPVQSPGISQRENFLQLDIYYPHLETLVVQQQAAYTIPSFFAEIGGFLGLLVGASILTIVEFLDVLILNVLSHRRQDKG